MAGSGDHFAPFVKPFFGLASLQGAGAAGAAAPFDHADRQALFDQIVGRCLTGCTRADNDDIIGLGHAVFLFVS